MRRAHAWIGLGFAAVFAATGAYMQFSFPELHGDDMGTRMMYRSAHVYILLAALVNVALAIYWRPAKRRRLQAIGSWLVLLAPLVLTTAFFVEPAPDRLDRPLSLAGVVLVAAGVGLQALSGRASQECPDRDS